MNMLPTRELECLRMKQKKYLESAEYKLDYGFKRLKKVDKSAARHSQFDKRVDKQDKKILRSPLNVGDVFCFIW